MKKAFKILAVIISLVVTALLCTSCRNLNLPGENFDEYWVKWYVENETGQEVILKFSENEDERDYIVKPSENVNILSQARRKKEDAVFCIIEEIRGYYPVALYLKNEDTPIRTWRPGDKNESGKQFYNESSWSMKRDAEGLDTDYTFHITEEDLE